MKLKPHAPTRELLDAISKLLAEGCASLDIPALFPGVPVFKDDEPANVVAPYLLVDCIDEPSPWQRTSLWRNVVRLKLVQPIETPTDPAVDLDYDSSVKPAYERNLESIVLGRFPRAGEEYDPDARNTFWTLSDLLLAVAEEQKNRLVLVDVWSLHRPDCADAGPPVRQKFGTETDDELEFEFVLVGGVQDEYVWELEFADFLDGDGRLLEDVKAMDAEDSILATMSGGVAILTALAAVLHASSVLSLDGTVVTIRQPRGAAPDLLSPASVAITQFVGLDSLTSLAVGAPN